MAIPQHLVIPTYSMLNSSSTILPLTIEDAAPSDNDTVTSGSDAVFAVVSWTAFCVMFIVGVSGNCVVLCMTCRPNSRLSISTINTYVMNLAIADLIYVIQYLFFTISNHLNSGWPFGMVGCKVIVGLDVAVMFVGAYILVAMSVERFVAIVFPMQSLQCRSVPCARWVCASLWFFGIIAIALPYVIHYDLVVYSQRTSCTWTKDRDTFRKYMTVICVVVLVIPSILMAVVYSGLLFHFWITVGQVGASLNKNLRRSKRRVVTVVFIIVLAFWVCYIPFWSWQMIMLYTNFENNTVGLFVVILSYLNSCINPLLYTLLTTKFNRWRESKKSSRSTSKVALRSL